MIDPSPLDSIKNKINDKTILYRIPIKFWVYRRSEGKGGMTLSGMSDQIRFLNFFHYINNTGIQFYLRPDFKFIDKTRLYNLNYITQAPLQTFLRHSNGCINVFVAGKLNQNRMFKKNTNYAGTFNRLTKGVLMANGVSCPTLTHETGHYFKLKHPHKHWKSRLLQEPVNRDRTLIFSKKKACEKRGDDLCDTPAEPNMDIYTDNYCRYTGVSLTDKYGDCYVPNTDNIMSYTQNRECRTTFTDGQIKRMHAILWKNKNAMLWSTKSENARNFEFDYYEPDDFKEMAAEIFFNTPQNRTFHKIVSSKRKMKFEDQSDWMYFEMNTDDAKDIQIQFSKNTYEFPEILVSVFYEDKLIFEQIIKKNQVQKTLKLKKIYPGKTYIRITQNAKEKSITGYQMMILK
jgi:hypothetical protein